MKGQQTLNPSLARQGAGFPWRIVLAIFGLAFVVIALIWQAIAAQGAPDPTAKGLSHAAMAFSSGVLVFREGLEAVLVLAVVTSGLIRSRQEYWRSVLAGAAAACLATIATWFIAVAIISSVNAPMLQIQAVTGLLAIAVLLVVMNWFFHKVYWTGWIGHHSARGRNLLRGSTELDRNTFWGLALLGFTAVYREGFEIVLFLQDLRLKAGTGIILTGAGIGLLLTCIVAGLVFSAHQRLPYKKMLVWAGILLGVVMVVMVGESVQEMQLAYWLPSTNLSLPIPSWVGTWFAVFPTVEGFIGQTLAILFVVGPFAWVRTKVRRMKAAPTVCPVNAEPLDCVIAHPSLSSLDCAVCEDGSDALG
ncbi:MAG: FTR1 family protein [Armatimonadetes bacterium]|nr:FTR1 family protein [Armatimonadota bacterium]